MITIAFYTVNTPYEEEVKKLESSLQILGLPYELFPIASKGNWVRNCAQKPLIIKEAMEKYPDEDILYVDADAIIHKNPVYFKKLPPEVDIGVHYKNGKELLSGTIFIRNNKEMKRLVDKWILEQEKNPVEWDQKTLQRVVDTYDHKINVDDIPSNYTQIFDLMKKEGDPIIEHFQASRKHRNAVSNVSNIPEIIDGMRVRVARDGSFFLPRSSKDTRLYMDDNYDRVPGYLRWFPKMTMGKDLAELAPAVKNKWICLVGKGPSLDRLSRSDFKNPQELVIGINESIFHLESLSLENIVFGFQQDERLNNKCKPKKAPIILSRQAAQWYTDHDNKYVFRLAEQGLQTNSLSAICLIKIFSSLGCKGFRLYCFDACVNGDLAYAKVIGHSSSVGGTPNRFNAHRGVIEAKAKLTEIELEWIMPKVLDLQEDDKLQPSQDNLVEHREHAQSQS